MKVKALITLFVAAAALMLPSLGHAQQRDTLKFDQGIDLDINLIDSEDEENEATVSEPSSNKKGKNNRKDRYTQADTVVFNDLYLDTVVVKKKNLINDYTMIGVQYGVGVVSAMYNPNRSQRFALAPVNFGVTYTRYGKMFGFMPWFGFQAGVYYGTDGYRFKHDKETDEPVYTESKADKALISTIDGTMNAHAHFDFWKLKLIVNVGYYLGYRLDINRYLNNEVISTSFEEYDRRFDYGVKGGVGFGIVLDPIEFHVTAMYKQSFQNLFEPNYKSDIYYRYAYPYGVTINAGIHVQLTKRVGKTTHQIKAEAKEAVFNKKDDSKRSEDRTDSIFGRF